MKEDPVNYSQHIEDWGDVTPSNHDVAIGLLFALFMFIAGILFDNWFIVGVLHI